MGQGAPENNFMQEEANEMNRWIMLLMIVALLIVGLHAYGSVNQFEVETGLTVDALMLPMEKTVDNCEPTNVVAYTEFAVANQYNWNQIDAMIDSPYYISGALMAEVNQASTVRLPIRLEDRLKYPLYSDPMGVAES